MHILDGALRAFSELDHFGDVTEMIRDRMPTLRTGLARLRHHPCEVALVGVAEHTR